MNSHSSSIQKSGGFAPSAASHHHLAKLSILGVLALGALALPWVTAQYNVAATAPHHPFVERLLRSGMERSVARHAAHVVVPKGIDLRNPALAATAIGHYSAACAGCHAAPGQSRAPWMVLYPEPSDLTRKEVVDKWSDSELYWIIKNGIKDTGMIALGPTHQERDLWAVSAIVRQLPELSPERYAAMVAEHQRTQEHAHHHKHSAQQPAP